MSKLAWIIAACVAGGALSVMCAAVFALNRHAQKYLGMMVSYAIGAMLGAVFLDILPEAIRLTPNVAMLSGTVLFGIMLYLHPGKTGAVEALSPRAL
jgi:zinc and cadmium transporter